MLDVTDLEDVDMVMMTKLFIKWILLRNCFSGAINISGTSKIKII